VPVIIILHLELMEVQVVVEQGFVQVVVQQEVRVILLQQLQLKEPLEEQEVLVEHQQEVEEVEALR